MDAEQIRKVNMEYSMAELEDKTILFIENYYCGVRGIISRIFYDYLSDPMYSDYKLVWLARDHDEAVRRFGAWLNDERVWLCIKNGYDFVRYLNTAKYIYTADYLPSFFQKREEQLVYYAPIDYILARKQYTRAMLWRFWASINLADHIIAEDNTPGIEKVIEKTGYESVKKVPVINEEYYIGSRQKVFVSFAGEKNGISNKNSFYYIYSMYTALADAYGYDVHWRVPLSLYKKLISDESISDSLKNVNSTGEEVLSLFGSADIIVTDNMCDLTSASKKCEKIILFSDQISEIEEMAFSKDFYITNDFEVLSDIYEMMLSGSETIPDVKDHDKKTGLPDCPKELLGEKDYKVVKSNTGPLSWDPAKESASREKGRVLILTETCGLNDFLNVLNERLEKYKDKVSLTVLFRSSWNGTLYDQIADLDTDIPYICRSGEMQCKDEFKEAMVKAHCVEKSRIKEAVQNEWKRILGKTDFDHAIGIKGNNIFWNNMYEFVPAPEFDLYEKKQLSSAMVDEIEAHLKAFTEKTQ